MEQIHGYPKIYTLGHAAIKSLFEDEVTVQEKIDGSQFSMSRTNGELFCRSKGKPLVVDAPEKMFNKAVETAIRLQPLLIEGAIYRGEFLSKPKHNVLAYDRVPKQNFILFDVELPGQNFLSYDELKKEADRLDLEVVPELFRGKIEDITQLYTALESISLLGGQKIEGFVVKNHKRFGLDGKPLFGKYVSEAFKEVHQGEWRDANPSTGDILQRLVLKYQTPARFDKAIQHLREAGQLTDSPKDIGPLMKEVQKDILEECSEEIKQDLFQYAWDHIQRRIVGGLPDYYKKHLMQKQFEE